MDLRVDERAPSKYSLIRLFLLFFSLPLLLPLLTLASLRVRLRALSVFNCHHPLPHIAQHIVQPRRCLRRIAQNRCRACNNVNTVKSSSIVQNVSTKKHKSSSTLTVVAVSQEIFFRKISIPYIHSALFIFSYSNRV